MGREPDPEVDPDARLGNGCVGPVDVRVDADVAFDRSRGRGGVRTGDRAEERTDGPTSAQNDAIDPEWLADRLAAAATQVNRPIGAITVRVVSDRTMIELHGRHCGDPTTTDVLTFPRDLGSVSAWTGDAVSADIAVCADQAMRNAAERSLPLTQELLLYALHGLLHCCGHDDHDPGAYAAMHAEEDRILSAIGVGRTFCPVSDGVAADGHVDRRGGPA